MKKSESTKEVLQLMDKDLSYSEAIKIVLNETVGLNRKQLEKELNYYI